MSYLTLNPEVRRTQEAALGPIPDPNSPEFEAFLESRRTSQPAAVEALLQGLEVAGPELPEETQARLAAARAYRRGLLWRLFFSRGYGESPAFNKRKALAVTVGTLLILLPLVFVLDRLVATPAGDVALIAASPAPQAIPLVPAAPDSPPASTLAPTPSSAAAPLPATPALPPPPGPLDPAIATTPPRSSTQPLEVVPPPATLGLAIAHTAPPPALSLSRVPLAPTTLSIAAPTPAAMRPLSLGIVSTLPAPLLPDTPTAAPPGKLAVVSAALTPSIGLEAPFPVPSPAVATPELPQAALAPIPPSAPPPALVEPALRPGLRLPAALLSGLALVEGHSLPVIAETPVNGLWCAERPCPALTWLGTASLDAAGRVTLAFDRLVIGSDLRSASALALGEDGLPGVPAAVRDVAPSVAQDLVRAAAGAVSAYVDALARRRSVTVVDGVGLSQPDLPSLGQVVLGHLGGLFALPTAQTTLIRLHEVAPGTPIVVLYGVSGDGR